MFKRKIREEVVYIANGMLEAESVKIMLESFGITSYFNQESAGTVYGLTVGSLGEVQVLVPYGQITEARKIIEDMRAGKLEIDDTDSDDIQREMD